MKVWLFVAVCGLLDGIIQVKLLVDLYLDQGESAVKTFIVSHGKASPPAV